jgi:uncharacterized protein (TIGR03437 family)
VNRIQRSILAAALFLPAAMAAPKLRLSNASIGPVTIAQGQSGTQQSVDAANAGDGALALSASANVSWISASIGGPRACALAASCLPVNIALNTASLARGKYTGTVTVNDPNAIDAPQTITVTVQIGGGVPDSIDLYVPPTGSTQTSFATSSSLNTSVTNQPGGPVVSVAAAGGGSFSFSYSFQVKAQTAGTAEGDYRSTLSVAGSTFAADNKTVPVNVHVTTQPIAEAAPAAVRFRIAQGAAKQEQYVAILNRGMGSLTLSTVTGGAPWLTAAVTQGLLVDLVADAGTLAPGSYNTTLSVATNARNGAASIPVQLDVLAPAAPTTFYRGVLENATFVVGDPVAPGGIAALFGEQLSSGPPTAAQKLPLDTALGGAAVFVNDKAAPIYYASAGQINFIVPYGTPAGEARVRVDRDGRRGNTVSLSVVDSSPRLLPLGIGTYANAVLSDSITRPIPATPGIASRPATAGDVITFYALGLGATDPPVEDGVAAPVSPLAQVPGFRAFFGAGNLPNTGVAADPFFVGLTPGLVGLYQINVVVPDGAPHGDAVPVALGSGSAQSNRVTIAIQ